MNAETLIRRFHDYGGYEPEAAVEPDSLIGFFQAFRPDGLAIQGLYDEVDVGDQLHSRLERLYHAAGDDRRPQGGRDAYFVIRNPQPLDPDEASHLATEWLEGVHELATTLGDLETAEVLSPTPKIRVLEGVAPKHPKAAEEKSRLLRTLQEDAAVLVDRIDAGPLAPILRPAYYFTACDTMLRDYLMWPLYASMVGLDDPLAPYFELWRHGVKFRIFGETQVDLYLPRHQG